ncbi:hypothetical protein [Reichenbachiella versicolor]|uniref:hypothetical protein n=1 Tax=Reichenbachiella versicolor TaxID=1821036 RepID=UPI000D6EAA55|nr:hypothetical protein [Reichenbachiella versicolor]
MFEATNLYLDHNAAIWNAIPILTKYKTALNQVIEGIKQNALDQDSAQITIGGSIRELKQVIADKMDILDDSLEAYADDMNDSELLAQASNSKSDYFRLSHEEFETKTKNVIGLLEKNVDAMADYGMTVEQIEDVKTNFNSFQEKRGMPRAYQIASRIATQSLEELFEEGNKALTRLDKVMSRFRRSNVTFYIGYEAARHIVKS